MPASALPPSVVYATVTGSSIGPEPVVATEIFTWAVPPSSTGYTAASVMTFAFRAGSAFPYSSTPSIANFPGAPGGRVSAYPHISLSPRIWSMPPTGW